MTTEKLSAAVQLVKSGNKQAAIPLLKEIIYYPSPHFPTQSGTIFHDTPML
jgi:hypothetical protein